MPFVRPAAALLLAASAPFALTGCGLFGERGPVKIAAIGTLNPSATPLNGELSSANAALLDATSQGLVSYDGEGQIDTGLADRWTVTTDGRSYIFRLREAKWTNGRKVTAEDVAAILRSYLAPASRHVLKNDFPEVDTIKAMTDTVIEIRLAVPQPAILELLAQPSMAIVNKGMGWGPMRARKIGRAVLLSPVPDTTLLPRSNSLAPHPQGRLRGSRMAMPTVSSAAAFRPCPISPRRTSADRAWSSTRSPACSVCRSFAPKASLRPTPTATRWSAQFVASD
jgi:hypothetical protein